MNIQDRLKKGRLIFDGAMGTQIQKMETNPIIPEVLNIESSEDITEIHRRYIEAGAQVITTNTFNANPLKLQKAGLEVKQVVTQGVACAKEASKGKEVYVALDMGPIGQLLEPAGTLTFDQAYDIFKEQVIAGEKAGADLVLIETMSDIYEMKSAVLAVKENTKLPVFCTMTFAENQKTMNGTDAQTLVTYLEALKVDVLGVNCSTGPNKLKYVVEDILQYASIPVMVQPNAGLPVFKDGKTEYDIDKTEFVQEMEKMIRKGVHVVGGCCGTSPDYIEMLVKAMENIPEQARLEQEQENDFPTVASSYRKTVAYDGHLVVVSENLIAAFKRELREGIEKSDYGKFSAIARKDKKAGADLINLNAFVPGTDEEMHLPRIIKSIQRSNDLPIQVESRNEKALEQALRYYNGKAVVNGINASQESMEKIFPLLARYGGVGVVMAIDEKGAAKTAGERLEVAKKIVRTAETIGIKKRDLIIDCVSLSVLTNPKKAIEALKTLQLVKEELGVTVMLGVGNISYGLSHRVLLDRTYLSMAAAYGLDTLIMNPQQKEIMDEIRAIDLLMNRDPFAQKYEKAFQSSDKEFMESGVDEKSDSKKILALFEKYRNGMLSLAQFIHGIEELKRNRSIREETFKESAVFLHLDGDDYSVTAEVSAVLLDSLGFETKVFDEEILLSNEEELWESSLLILSANLFSKAQKAETIAKKAKARNPKLKILTSGFAFHQDTERDWADEHIQEPGDLLSFVKKYKDK